MNRFKISEKSIGGSNQCFIIAEIAQAHDGSLGIAHSYIDAIAATGADAIKFQTHIASAESTKEETFRVNFSYEDLTRYDYWKRMEFTSEQWKEIATHCNDVGIIFLSSPFSVEAVTLLDNIGMPAWKVGSGEVNNPIILDAITSTKKPILLSTGMSSWKEIHASVLKVLSTGSPLSILQCTSKYPTSLIDVGLNIIEEMRSKYSVPIGLSDHSGTIFPGLAAIANRIDLMEVHVVFDRRIFGPDTSSSITLQELNDLVEFRNNFNLMDKNPVDKDVMALNLSEMRQMFNKSIVISKSIKQNSTLTKDVLTVKKPGIGLAAHDIEEYIGKKVNKSLNKGDFLKKEDLYQ